MITIDTELPIEYRDIPPWRSYRLTAQGETLNQLLESATISEVGQDGDDLKCYGLEDRYADDTACLLATEWITSAWEEEQAKRPALEAGIPLSVVEGKTKLKDHFSKEVIDFNTGKTE